MSTIVLRATARLLTPVIVVLAVFFMLRGHDDPGGGFIAGLILGAGVVLRWLAFGPEGVGVLLPVRPAVLLAGGLAVAVVTGLVPLVFGEPFLSGTVVGTRVVGVEVKVATSLIFDVGVMSIVLGMVGTFVVALGQER